MKTGVSVPGMENWAVGNGKEDGVFEGAGESVTTAVVAAVG
jgi:hypothetical protein